MSYDIYLRCPTCGSSPDCPGPTYNLTPIFDLALTGEALPNPNVSEAAVVLFHEDTDRPRGLRLLSGRRADATLADIDRAIARLSDETLRETLEALAPQNKWGTLSDALWVMRKLRELAATYPDRTWEAQ